MLRRLRLLGLRLAPQRTRPANGHQPTVGSSHPRQADVRTIPASVSPTGPLSRGQAEDHRSLQPQPGIPAEERAGLELKGILELVGSVAAPVTLISAVLFYFGWIYTAAFYRYFAIDRTVLELAVRDYVLRSINPMLWPLILALTLAGLWTFAHGLVVRSLASGRGRRLVRRLSLVLGAVGTVAFLTGLIAPQVGNPYTSLARELLGPLGLAVGAALVGYAGHLYRRAHHSPPGSSPGGAGESRLLRGIRLGLVALLITINLLWAVTYFAEALGRGDAYRLAANRFGDKPAVVVYSSKRLFLDPFGGVQEAPLEAEDGAYRYRYANLRLLIRAGGKYFLVPRGWSTADPVVVVLSDNDTVRVEFLRT